MFTTTPDICSVPERPETGICALGSAAGEPSHSGEYLSDCSPRDRPWDLHRSQADCVTEIYLSANHSRWFTRLGERMAQCAQVLVFGWELEKHSAGALTLKLRRAYFCRVRHCPVCQWRRSKMWIARFLQASPHLLIHYPRARFLYLTLTQKNVSIAELATTLQQMSKAWGRLTKRKEFAPVLGWIRAVEVTRGKDGTAHPHYHILLMVPGNYFRRSGSFVTQPVWTSIWRDSLRLDYDPIVHVETVKARSATRNPSMASAALMDAARETLKYSVTPMDMVADPDWLLELTRQLHKRRFIASGGVLRGVLREKNETNDDLLVLGEGSSDKTGSLHFDWSRPVRRYRRRSQFRQ